MDERALHDILSGRRRGVGASLLRAGLSAAAVPYTLAMVVRRWAYRCRMLPSRAADVPVICVGNLTTGGTGKTPTVAWVVRHLKDGGKHPAVLTRGYKAVDGLSDEATLLEQACHAPVVVNGDRVAGARQAVAEGADVLVMDDGYQHRRLRRDLDLVLVSAIEPFGYGWCLPRGLLREPLRALRDAHAVLITHSDAVPPERLGAVCDRVRQHAREAPIALARHAPAAWIDPNGTRHPLDVLAGRKAMAFCGIASPEQFFRTLGDLHVRLVERHALDDHVEYSPETIGLLERKLQAWDTCLAVTTEKDYVKLGGTGLAEHTWRLAVEMEVAENEDALLERIRRAAGVDSGE